MRKDQHWSIGKWVSVGLAVLIAGLLMFPADLAGCDDPIYAIARQRWPLELYLLLLAHQPGVGDTAAFEKAVKQDWLTDQVNLYPLAFDMSRPVQLAQDRALLAALGISGYPVIALLDESGKELVRLPTLAEARDRLAPPSTQPEVVSFGRQKIQLDKPPARLVIIYDSEVSVNDPPPPTTQPDAEKPAPVQTPSRRRARQWAARIAADPLAGLAKADLIDIRHPGDDRTVIETLKLHPLPVCVLADPDGLAIEVFDQAPSPEQVSRMVLSPTRDKVVQVLGQPETAVVILFVYGDDAQENIHTLAAVNHAARQAGDFQRVGVPVVQMDPTDPREHYLVRQLGRWSQMDAFDPYRQRPARKPAAEPGKRQATVVPIIGRGKAMEPIRGRPSSDDVLDAIQLAFHACGCAVVPRDIGRDLLLGAGGGPWEPFDSRMAAAISKGARSSPVLDEMTREMALSSFGVDPRLWVGLGVAVLAGLGLIGGLVLWLKLRAAAQRAG